MQRVTFFFWRSQSIIFEEEKQAQTSPSRVLGLSRARHDGPIHSATPPPLGFAPSQTPLLPRGGRPPESVLAARRRQHPTRLKPPAAPTTTSFSLRQVSCTSHAPSSPTASSSARRLTVSQDAVTDPALPLSPARVQALVFFNQVR